MALSTFIFSSIVLTFGYKTISTLVRKKLRATLTAVGDIPLLGIPREDGERINGTAVVCGGSIAGMLSARVCSDHFQNVVVIEPEAWLTIPEGTNEPNRDQSSSPTFQQRPRVPQHTALHGYQIFLTLSLRKLFGNYDLELTKAGGRFIPADLKVHLSGIHLVAPWHQYTPNTFPEIHNLTRAAFETMLRRLVQATCPNIRYIAGTVTGLVKSESTSDIIHSISLRSRDGEESTLPATLVIDCTGPALGGLRWLQTLSSASTTNTEVPKPSGPPKVTYDPKMGYSWCSFDVPERLIPSINALWSPEVFETAGFLYTIAPNPATDNRHLIIGRTEHNTLQFLCGGWDVRERLASISDIKNFMSQMIVLRPLPEWIHQLLELFEEEGVPAAYTHVRCPPSLYIQYHLAKNIPSNFIAIGDSMMQLNPFRGQGVSKACIETVTLNALLRKCAPNPANSEKGARGLLPKDFSRTFFRAQANRTGPLWELSKDGDYGWKTTIPSKGEDPQRFMAWRRAFQTGLIGLLLKDPDVASVAWHISNWLAPATDMLSPIIALKLAWMQVQGYFGL